MLRSEARVCAAATTSFRERRAKDTRFIHAFCSLFLSQCTIEVIKCISALTGTCRPMRDSLLR